MLGTQGSGKTMYLYGMYAKLSAGESGFFLYADDHDIDLSLAEGWDALTSDGLLPPPTDEKPQRYPFVLNDGFQKILELDWVDYRGGAWMSRVNGSEAADAPAMLQRLENSDSIYLVL